MEHQENRSICKSCGAAKANRYQLFDFTLGIEREFELCPRCARAKRRSLKLGNHASDGLSREELIEKLNQFFSTSGVFDVCARCHEQGTGCCPTTCRVMGERGCDPNNKYGKTVFCAAFVCSALLNAIYECDPEIGRALRSVKRDLGPAEFRIYEMITRVPASEREPVRPLALPERYPFPEILDDGEVIKNKLAALTDEILAIRRSWSENDV